MIVDNEQLIFFLHMLIHHYDMIKDTRKAGITKKINHSISLVNL